MAKTKGNTQLVFTVGGNLPDGTRVEAGDIVPANLEPAVMRSLKANNMVSDEPAKESADGAEEVN